MTDKEVNPKHYKVGRLEFYDGIMQMMGERVMTFKQAVDTWNVLSTLPPQSGQQCSMRLLNHVLLQLMQS